MADEGVAHRVDRTARDSRVLRAAVRSGLVGYGAVHLLIAWVAVRLAFGSGSGSATGEGALAELSGGSSGRATLGAMAIGFAALVVWQTIVAVVGFRDRQGWSRSLMRVGAAVRSLIYGYLAVASARFLLSGPSGSGASTDTMTARLMALPAGAILVVALGLTVAATGMGLGVFGVKRLFVEQLDEQARKEERRIPIVALGQVGYVVKGAALVIIGALLGWAGILHDPRKSGGLDQAFQELLGTNLGRPAVVVAGVGIGCFGLYLFALARHLDGDSMTS